MTVIACAGPSPIKALGAVIPNNPSRVQEFPLDKHLYAHFGTGPVNTKSGIVYYQNVVLRHDINGALLDGHVVFHDLDTHVGMASDHLVQQTFALRAKVRDDAERHTAADREALIKNLSWRECRRPRAPMPTMGKVSRSNRHGISFEPKNTDA